MVVMAIFAFHRIREGTNWAEKIFWVLMTILEGMARMELNYHTLEQVIAGTIFGVIYAALFKRLWQMG
jgi:membrane-associated phospholipid phosphatase